MSARGTLGRLTDRVRASLRGAGRADGDARPSSRPTAGRGDRPDGRRPDAADRGSGAEDHAGTGGVAVSYAPDHDGDADPGEVVWAWVPYEDDPTQGKDRPVLVLGYAGSELVAVPLSSKDHSDRRDAGEWIPVGPGGWDSEGRPSYADASRLLRYAASEVRREGAALDEARFTEVVAKVGRLHGWRA